MASNSPFVRPAQSSKPSLSVSVQRAASVRRAPEVRLPVPSVIPSHAGDAPGTRLRPWNLPSLRFHEDVFKMLTQGVKRKQRPHRLRKGGAGFVEVVLLELSGDSRGSTRPEPQSGHLRFRGPALLRASPNSEARAWRIGDAVRQGRTPFSLPP